MPGGYIIAAVLNRDIQIEVGSLGWNHFPAGVYCYCGSAHGPGGLRARIKRHLRIGGKKFWHFDYLREYVEVVQVWWQIGQDNLECEAAKVIAGESGANIPVEGFGASDCKKGCPAHLVHLKDVDCLEEAFRNLRRKGIPLQRKIMI